MGKITMIIWRHYIIAPAFIAPVFIALVFMALATPSFANTVTSERTEVSLITDSDTIQAGHKFWAALHIKMQPGWHTYWKNPGDSGMTPDLSWTLPKGFVAGEPQFPAPNRLKFGDLTDYGYENDSWVLVSVTSPSILRDNMISILSLKARWLVCKEVCIPESGDFVLSLPATVDMEAHPSASAAAIAEVRKKLPVPVAGAVIFSVSGDKMYMNVPLTEIAPDDIKSAQFFPAHGGLIDNNGEQKYDVRPGRLSFTLEAEKGKLPEKSEGVVSLFLENGERKDFAVALQLGITPDSGNTILKSVFLALIGGFILNLMPCVFPILSLKALAVAKKADKHPQEVRAHGIAYTLGVVMSFLALACVLIVVQISGRSVGWGYHMQSPTFVALLVVVFFMVGLNLSGFFEMPSLFGNVGGKAAAKDNLLGSFATGALAVLISTPCTAPFMAPAIGFAFTQDTLVIILIFVCLGLGLALPFLLISLFPALIKGLPKPGQWMVTFRQCCAFPVYIFTVWLLWVLAREAGEGAMFIVLLSLVFLAFALWLGKIKAKVATLAGLVVAVAAVFVIIGGMHTENGGYPQPVTERFSLSRIDALRKEGRPVFVDATADWCITCKVNESIALSSRRMHKLFAEKHISYVVADWTHGDKEITEYLRSFGRAGVPIYVYYPPGGKEPVVLPQILTESIVIEAIK